MGKKGSLRSLACRLQMSISRNSSERKGWALPAVLHLCFPPSVTHWEQSRDTPAASDSLQCLCSQPPNTQLRGISNWGNTSPAPSLSSGAGKQMLCQSQFCEHKTSNDVWWQSSFQQLITQIITCSVLGVLGFFFIQINNHKLSRSGITIRWVALTKSTAFRKDA